MFINDRPIFGNRSKKDKTKNYQKALLQMLRKRKKMSICKNVCKMCVFQIVCVTIKTFRKKKSVLISLISDTSPTRGPYIKLIFGTGSWNRSLLRPLHASTWYCSTSRKRCTSPLCVLKPVSCSDVERLRQEIVSVEFFVYFLILLQCKSKVTGIAYI